jgi:hypothetical protein
VSEITGPTFRNRPEGRNAITPTDAAQLRRLYTELLEATAAATEALSMRGLAGLALARFRELDARVSAVIKRIRQIVD